MLSKLLRSRARSQLFQPTGCKPPCLLRPLLPRTCLKPAQRAVNQQCAVLFPNDGSRNSDTATTFFNPSTVQKRACAKGRSCERQSTTVLSNFEASTLKRRTEAAHVGVSKLGKTLSTTRLPRKSLNLTVDRSPFTPSKSGAAVPTAGRLPQVFIALPFNFTVAMIKTVNV